MKRLLTALCFSLSLTAFGQGTVFSYQGVLNDNSQRANGSYDFLFTLYDSTNISGNVIAGPITNSAVWVTNGLFSTALNFGNVFDGSARWLGIAVRTNAVGSFVALSSRTPLTAVPYAMFSGSTTNLVGALSAANLAPVTALVASTSNALSSSFSTNLASFTNSGLETAADVIRLAPVPGQQEGIQRTPIRGYVSWYGMGANVNEPAVSNLMYSTKTSGLYNYGYRWIFVDDGWGTTNRDANGNLQWNTNKFPSGAGFVNVAHQMGYKVAVYTDGGSGFNTLTSSGAQAGSDPAHMAQDVNQFLKWNLDGGKWDMPLVNLEIGMAVLATNTLRPFYVIAGNPFGPNIGFSAQYASLVNAFRGTPTGDVTSYYVLLDWCDQFATNGSYRWVRPGHCYDFDGIYYADVGLGLKPFQGFQSQVIMDAISSGIMLHSRTDGSGFMDLGILPLLTNVSILDIQADPAVIAGQRVMQTNNVDVWLKPLGSENGPQFAIGMICRGVGSNVVVNVPLGPSGLNLPAAAEPTDLSAGYSVYDCLSNKWVSSTAISTLSVTLFGYQPALFRLFPGSIITTNYIQPFSYAPTLPAMVVSNGVQRIVNVPWDTDAAKFIARAQVASDPVQCYAVQFLFAKLKQAGLWTNRLDVLYPMIPAQPYLNAFSSNFTIVPVGPVSANAQGIAGNGIFSYFTNGYHFVNSATHFSLNSASLGVYNGNPSPNGLSWLGGFDGVSVVDITSFNGAVDAAINDITGSTLTYSGNAKGLWAVSRDSVTNSYIFGRSFLLQRSVATVSVPNSYMLLGAEMRNGFPGFESDAQLRGAWVGGSLSPSEISALNSIWDEYEAILGRSAQ